MNELLPAIIVVAITGLFAVFGYLIRAVINNLVTEVHELKGELKPLNQSLKDNTVELARIRSELDSVWRYIERRK